jgi:hypothetical protein
MAEERKVFHDSVIPLPDRLGIVQHDYYPAGNYSGQKPY